MWHWVYGRAGTNRRRSGDVSLTDFITWPRAEERFLNSTGGFRWGLAFSTFCPPAINERLAGPWTKRGELRRGKPTTGDRINHL
ncbi:MAG: hypothetical protein ACREA4_09545 [Nitrososphaera sp.]